MSPSGPMFHGALALVALAVITLIADQTLMAEVGPAPARSTELAEPIAPIPTSRAWDPRRVALGQRLFHRHSDSMEAQARVFRILLAVVGAFLLGYALDQLGRRRDQMRDRRRARADSERGTAGRHHTAATRRMGGRVVPSPR